MIEKYYTQLLIVKSASTFTDEKRIVRTTYVDQKPTKCVLVKLREDKTFENNKKTYISQHICYTYSNVEVKVGDKVSIDGIEREVLGVFDDLKKHHKEIYV